MYDLQLILIIYSTESDEVCIRNTKNIKINSVVNGIYNKFLKNKESKLFPEFELFRKYPRSSIKVKIHSKHEQITRDQIKEKVNELIREYDDQCLTEEYDILEEVLPKKRGRPSKNTLKPDDKNYNLMWYRNHCKTRIQCEYCDKSVMAVRFLSHEKSESHKRNFIEKQKIIL